MSNVTRRSAATSAHGTFLRNFAISNATAFDAFAVCTEAGPAISLEEEGDAAICGASPEGQNLAQKGIVDAITAFIQGGASRPAVQ